MQKLENISYAPKDSITETTLVFFTRPFFHFFIAFWCFGSAIAQLILFFMKDSAQLKSDFPMYILKLDHNVTTNEITYVAEVIFYANVFILNIIFLIPSGIFQVYYSYSIIKRRKNIAPHFKFIEFGLITPLMFCQLAILAGIRDFLTIVTVCGLVCSSMIFGYIQDRLSGNRDFHWEFTPHEWGYLSYIVMWGVLFAQFFIIASHKTYEIPLAFIVTIYGAFMGQTFFAVIQYYFVVIPQKLDFERIDDESILEMDGMVQLLSLLTKMWQAWIPLIYIIN